MAQDYNIKIRRFNGDDYDTLLPQASPHASTHASNGNDPLPASSVGTSQIADSAITTGKINNSAVTAGKIAANAVSNYYTTTTGASWSGSAAPYSITVTVNGLTTSDHPIVWLKPSTTYSTAASQANAWKYIYRVDVTSANTLTLYSSVKSNIALPIQMVVVRK